MTKGRNCSVLRAAIGKAKGRSAKGKALAKYVHTCKSKKRRGRK